MPNHFQNERGNLKLQKYSETSTSQKNVEPCKNDNNNNTPKDTNHDNYEHVGNNNHNNDDNTNTTYTTNPLYNTYITFDEFSGQYNYYSYNNEHLMAFPGTYEISEVEKNNEHDAYSQPLNLSTTYINL